MLALMAVGTLALRRIGSGRNRGRGHVQCSLYNSTNEITKDMDSIERFGRIR
jgi:hypothetical protein